MAWARHCRVILPEIAAGQGHHGPFLFFAPEYLSPRVEPDSCRFMRVGVRPEKTADRNMWRRVKDFLKSFLPRWVIEGVMRRREHRNLAPVPVIHFSAEALLPAADFDRDQVFAAISEFDSDWDASHSAIIRETTANGIASAVNPGDRKALYRVVRNFRPRRVLEFGTHVGMSTYYLAKALEANGGGEITTVDIVDVNSEGGAWRNGGLSKPPSRIVESLGLGDTVAFVVASAAKFLETDTGPYDLIYLDGDQSAASVYDEVARSLGMLSPRGLIVFHDFFPGGQRLIESREVMHGPYLAFSRLRHENPDLDVIPFSPLPWTTLRGSNNTSLAALVRR